MKKALLFLTILTVSFSAFAQSGTQEKVVTFKFVPDEDMFYIPWGGNDVELDRLYSLVDEYRAQITSGAMPVHVDGYCGSLESREDNLRTAAVRSNRVKSELITNKGLTEDNFITKNHAVAYTGADGTSHKDMVVVTLRIPAKVEPATVRLEQEREAAEQARREQAERERAERERAERERAERERAEKERAERAAREHEHASQPQQIPEPTYSRWSVGANIGLPFFWGDMTSIASDKTYIGVMVGLQGTYQATPWLGVSLSLDWAQNKAGSRGYATGYLLDASGMTWYTPQPGSTQAYGDLYSKINMFSAGLHLDVNVNHLFGPRIANSRLKLIVSPAIYGQHFSSKVYTKSDDNVFAGDHLSKDLSLGLGGDVALRYNVSPTIDVQLKGTGIWITDNGFDNIRTVGHVKQNAMWGVSAGVVWKIGGQRAPNLLYKKK